MFNHLYASANSWVYSWLKLPQLCYVARLLITSCAPLLRCSVVTGLGSQQMGVDHIGLYYDINKALLPEAFQQFHQVGSTPWYAKAFISSSSNFHKRSKCSRHGPTEQQMLTSMCVGLCLGSGTILGRQANRDTLQWQHVCVALLQTFSCSSCRTCPPA